MQEILFYLFQLILGSRSRHPVGREVYRFFQPSRMLHPDLLAVLSLFALATSHPVLAPVFVVRVRVPGRVEANAAATAFGLVPVQDRRGEYAPAGTSHRQGLLVREGHVVLHALILPLELALDLPLTLV